MWSDSFHLDQAPGHTDLHPPAALVLAQGEIVLLNYDQEEKLLNILVRISCRKQDIFYMFQSLSAHNHNHSFLLGPYFPCPVSQALATSHDPGHRVSYAEGKQSHQESHCIPHCPLVSPGVPWCLGVVTRSLCAALESPSYHWCPVSPGVPWCPLVSPVI